MSRSPLALVLVVLAGCASGPTPIPGSERVRVVSSESAVQGKKMVNSYSGTCGTLMVDGLDQTARNYAAQNNADVALLRTTSAGPHSVTFTIEAWR